VPKKPVISSIPVVRADLHVSAIYLHSHNHQFYCDIQKIYGNAIFSERLNLPPMDGHGVAFPHLESLGLP
jgi:hypothetical protein